MGSNQNTDNVNPAIEALCDDIKLAITDSGVNAVAAIVACMVVVVECVALIENHNERETAFDIAKTLVLDLPSLTKKPRHSA